MRVDIAKKLAQLSTSLLDETGGVLETSVAVTVRMMDALGGMGFLVAGKSLDLVCEQGLPSSARPWLARLPLLDEPWFVAQRAAIRHGSLVDTDLAAERQGLSIAPVLAGAGWGALLAVPLAQGRVLRGVIVLAATDEAAFTPERRAAMDAAAAMISLALSREEMRERLRERRTGDAQARELATVGIIATSMSKDLELPQRMLTAELKSLGAIRDELAEGDAERRAGALDDMKLLLEDAGETLAQLERTTERLSQLQRPIPNRTVDLADVADEASALVAAALEERGVLIEVEATAEELPVAGRVMSLLPALAQMFVSLALDAPERTRLTLRLAREGDRCVLAVDRASPMAPLKPARGSDRPGADEGALDMLRQAMRGHQGHVELVARKKSRTLRVVFAAAETAPSEDRSRKATPILRRADLVESAREPTIVWIDDDAAFVRAMCRLVDRGKAEVAGNLAEARELLTSLAEPPDLILCDVHLPDGLGIDLHREVDDDVASRFVFITGALVSGKVAKYLRESGRPTLIKPIDADEIFSRLSGGEDTGIAVAHTLAH